MSTFSSMPSDMPPPSQPTRRNVARPRPAIVNPARNRIELRPPRYGVLRMKKMPRPVPDASRPSGPGEAKRESGSVRVGAHDLTAGDRPDRPPSWRRDRVLDELDRAIAEADV